MCAGEKDDSDTDWVLWGPQAAGRDRQTDTGHTTGLLCDQTCMGALKKGPRLFFGKLGKVS